MPSILTTPASRLRPGALLKYLAVAATGNLLWEIAQLPFYTLWRTGTPAEITFAVVHCTGGDVLIALATLTAAWLLTGLPRWPEDRFAAVCVLTIGFGIGYTVFSEWLNTTVLGTWAYADAMPRLPPWGTGLTPLLQWLIIPALALESPRRQRSI
jgi:hypothetical protein